MKSGLLDDSNNRKILGFIMIGIGAGIMGVGLGVGSSLLVSAYVK